MLRQSQLVTLSMSIKTEPHIPFDGHQSTLQRAEQLASDTILQWGRKEQIESKSRSPWEGIVKCVLEYLVPELHLQLHVEAPPARGKPNPNPLLQESKLCFL